MKVYLAKTNEARKRNRRGFTLIEMIGVLAVIAILAAVLIPKVFEAINNARVNNAAMTYNTVKTAIADHYAKFGSIPVNGSTGTPVVQALPIAQYDSILLAEGFLDKPFTTKIGDGLVDATHTRVEAIDITTAGFAAGATVGADDASGFNLDGVAATKNEMTGSVAVVAVISGVTENDAKDLNDRLDGPTLGVGIGGAPDTKGRVKYAAPANGVTTVYIYVTHR